MENNKYYGGEELGMGWIPDYPDFRDYTIEQDKISPKLKKLGEKDSIKGMLEKIGIDKPLTGDVLPSKVDLRKWCSPIEKQGGLNSCSAHAGVGIVEYFERKAYGKHIDASRLFLYKTTRNILKWKGYTGAYLRTTIGALTLFGVPPEEYMPYDVSVFDNEPTSFCYSFAQNYQTTQYFRLDPFGVTKDKLLNTIKTNLVGGVPSIFGFTVYKSIGQASSNGGKIPYPYSNESTNGGHALMTIGYDDSMTIKNKNYDVSTIGALLIRNSWGTGWGDTGYGWLPYDYILKGLAIDWWSILNNEWVDTQVFKI